MEENKMLYESQHIYVYTKNSQNLVELSNGLPYQLLEYDNFKITYKDVKEIDDYYIEYLEGEVTASEEQANGQHSLLLQLKEMYNLNINIENINEKQLFEAEYAPRFSDYEIIRFKMINNDLTIAEGCSRTPESFGK